MELCVLLPAAVDCISSDAEVLIVTELMSSVVQILGPAPAGLEPIVYITAAALLVILCMSAVSLISGLFRYIGGL